MNIHHWIGASRRRSPHRNSPRH